jgi:two-component system CheB/CheR fusion protein
MLSANHVAGLTPQQRKIMELVLGGRSSKCIGAELGISQRTAENHRAAIMRKSEVGAGIGPIGAGRYREPRG